MSRHENQAAKKDTYEKSWIRQRKKTEGREEENKTGHERGVHNVDTKVSGKRTREVGKYRRSKRVTRYG